MSGRGHPLLSRNGLFLLSSTCDERSLKWNLWPGKHLRFIGVPVLRINSFWPVVREHHQIALLDASLDAWAYGTRLCWTLFKCSGEVVLPVVVLLFYAWTTLFIEGHWKTLFVNRHSSFFHRNVSLNKICPRIPDSFPVEFYWISRKREKLEKEVTCYVKNFKF